MRTIHVLYDKKNNALGVVDVGDKDLPEALRDAVEWRYEGRRYSYRSYFRANRGQKNEYLDVIMKEY